MANAWTRKLRTFADLGVEDEAVLRRLCERRQSFAARTPILVDGMAPTSLYVLQQGFACRSKQASDGRRHILAFLLAGDECNSSFLAPAVMDHDVLAISSCSVAAIPFGDFLDEVGARPALQQAVLATAQVEHAISRRWIAIVGRRSAEERIAHLLCELAVRLHASGMAAPDGYPFPLTQADLAEACALTPVHTNRVLQTLRRRGVVELGAGRLRILDWKRLAVLGGFHGAYLGLPDRRSAPPAPRASTFAERSFTDT